MYMCVYTYIYIYIYMYTYVHLSLSLYIYIYIYIHMYICCVYIWGPAATSEAPGLSRSRRSSLGWSTCRPGNHNTTTTAIKNCQTNYILSLYKLPGSMPGEAARL